MPILKKTSIPGPKSLELMARRREAVARGPFHTTAIFVDHAKGAVLTDVDGNQLIDFAAGIGVVNTGHCNGRVVEAIRHQSEKLVHGSFNVTPYEGYVSLCEKLNESAPGDFKKKSFLANSGAEAVENALKIARAHTGRMPVVCFEHAFHGRTFMALALTYKEKPYRAGFGISEENIIRAPFPYVYRWAEGQGSGKGGDRGSVRSGSRTGSRGLAAAVSDETRLSDDQVADECFHIFEEKVKASREKPAAVIIEPILGEGGFIPAPDIFLQKLERYCRKEGIVFIADEIQTGFGRTGTLYACEGLEVTPDLVLSAKGLGGGLPISAVTGRAEMMDAPSEGGIGGTFGGNPVACAAALAVFEELSEGGLEKARALGVSLKQTLEKWKTKFECIGDVRGLGPMQALEIVKDRRSKTPDAERTKKLMKDCHENGVVIMSAGSAGNVIRFLIPLVIEKNDLEEGLRVVEAALGRL